MKKLMVACAILALTGMTLSLTSCPPKRPVIGFSPQLSISSPPDLGKTVSIKLTFTTVIPTTLGGKQLSYLGRIELPPGFYEVVWWKP
jgi:hypothetical protein